MRALFFSFLLWLALPNAFLQAETWKEVSIPSFHFRYPAHWERIAQSLIRRAPRNLEDLSKAYQLPFKGRISVRLSDPGPAFANIQPHGWKPHSDIAGLAYPKRSLITMRIRRVEGSDGIHQTFLHELSHIYLAYATQHREVPLWFNEGVAMLLSHDFGDFQRFLQLAQARVAGRIPSLAQIRERFPHTSANRQLAYAASFDAVLFLRKQNPQFLAQITASMRKGKSFQDALHTAIQGKAKAGTFEQQWRQSLTRRYGWLPLLANETTIWGLAVFLFFLAYWRVRKQRQIQFSLLDDEPSDDPQAPFGPQETKIVTPAEASSPSPSDRFCAL